MNYSNTAEKYLPWPFCSRKQLEGSARTGSLFGETKSLIVTRWHFYEELDSETDPERHSLWQLHHRNSSSPSQRRISEARRKVNDDNPRWWNLQWFIWNWADVEMREEHRERSKRAIFRRIVPVATAPISGILFLQQENLSRCINFPI